jgi:anti-sigma factor RsiW
MTHISEEALVDYLYDEGDAAERLKIARHLHDCAACSVAVLELQSVRGLLSEWKPPPVPLGFKIVAADAETPAPSLLSWRRIGAPWPAWAQAAAGFFLFAAGVAFSQLHVEYGNGALTVRAKSAPSLAMASTVGDITLPAAPVLVDTSAQSPDLNALQRTLQSDLAPGSGSPTGSDEVLRRVKAMIDQSEGRQQRELALRLSQLVQDFDTQRRADMLNVEQNFGQLEGQTGAEVAQQRELLNSLVKVSQQPQQTK